MSQSSRILDFLSDGRARTVREIHAACGFSRLNSRVAELRSRGHNIVCERVTGETGSDGFTYQLVGALAAPPAPSPSPIRGADGAASAPCPEQTGLCRGARPDAAPADQAAGTDGGRGALQLTLIEAAA